MNTLTQQQINQYQWQVADDVARIHNGPVFSVDWNNKENDLSGIEFQTNAPDGIYSGEAFELIDQYCGHSDVWIDIDRNKDAKMFEYYKQREDIKLRIFLRLKPSHLPAVLTTQPGEEWKDRYNEVWLESFNGGLYRKGSPMRMRYFKDFDAFVKSLGTAFKAKREWHLITPPAEQEAKTVVKDASYYEILSNVPGRQQEGINIALLKIWGEVEKWYGDPKKQESGRELLLRLQKEFNINFANRKPNHFETIDQLQSTLTQKDQRIAELEQMLDQCQKSDLYFEQVKEQLNNRIAELEKEREWISVDERLPEGQTEVLVFMPKYGSDMSVYFLTDVDPDRNTWFNCFWNSKPLRESTHWMPLPTPPQH